MKALSLRQPWAYLAASGQKDVENRRWSTNYRGPLLLHASRTPDEQFVPLLRKLLETVELPATLDYGGIVGVATLVDCVSKSHSPWFCGPYGLVLAEARPLPFTPWPGQLGLFEVPDEVMGEGS